MADFQTRITATLSVRDWARVVDGWLQETTPTRAPAERRDVWHEPWALALIVVCLSAEWTLRRRWALR